MRREVAGMEHSLMSHSHTDGGGNVFAGVQVATEMREVAAGDVNSDPMALLEDVARWRHLDPELSRLITFQELHLIESQSISSSDDAFRDRDRKPRRTDVEQAYGEIGVQRR
jgi:hypothetical protein